LLLTCKYFKLELASQTFRILAVIRRSASVNS